MCSIYKPNNNKVIIIGIELEISTVKVRNKYNLIQLKVNEQISDNNNELTTLNELKFPFIQRDFKQKNLSIYMRGSLKFNNFLPSDITTFTVVYNLHKSKNEQSKLDNYHNYIQSNGLSDNSPHHMSKQW